jgi:polyisoprenyl-phosphate glycosyltransferase
MDGMGPPHDNRPAMSLVSIVVPVFQNAPSLPDLVARFRHAAEECSGDRFEFVFVDDGSTDDSLAVLTALGRDDPRIRIVKLSRNFGSSAATLAGLGQARGDAVVAIAADLQDPPELIPEMVRAWHGGRKVVLAARRHREDPFPTRILAGFFYQLFRRFAIRTMPTGGFDFFLVDRQVRDLIVGIEENNAYLMGLILWLGFEPAVITYARRRREERYGLSMWTLSKRIKYFVDSFVAFSYLPLRLVSLTGFLVVVLGFLYAALIFYLRLVRGFPVEGWTSLMLVLLVTSGVQILTLGVLGEYLWRNLEETRKRPRFVVEAMVETTGVMKNARTPPAERG